MLLNTLSSLFISSQCTARYGPHPSLALFLLPSLLFLTQPVTDKELGDFPNISQHAARITFPSSC